MRNECQYVCLWEEGDDSNALLDKPDLSVEDLLRAGVQRQQREAAAAQQQPQQEEAAAAPAWGGGQEQEQDEEPEEQEHEEDLTGVGGFFQRAVADMTVFFEQLGGEVSESLGITALA